MDLSMKNDYKSDSDGSDSSSDDGSDSDSDENSVTEDHHNSYTNRQRRKTLIQHFPIDNALTIH